MNSKTEHNLYYIKPENIQGDVFIISGYEFHHLKKVMRKKQGDTLALTDGSGNEYVTQITRVDKSEIHLHVIEKKFHTPTTAIAITVAFVPLKGHRNDFILEKGTELGVRGFIAFMSRYSVLQRLGDQKVARFNNIIMSAMMQSRQYYLPELSIFPSVEELTSIFDQYDQVMVADVHGRHEEVTEKNKVLYIVGPEGGFDDREMEMFSNHGVFSLRLGVTRLRSETAAIAGLVKILSAYQAI